MAGKVRRRRHHRSAAGRQDALRRTMARNAHRDGVESGGGEVRHRAVGRPRQHQRQRSRPERGREPRGAGVEAGEPACGRDVGHVRDQRIERGTSLGLVEARHRLAVGGVGAEPVHRFGGKGDQAAGAQRARRELDGRRIGADQAGRRFPRHPWQPVLAHVTNLHRTIACRLLRTDRAVAIHAGGHSLAAAQGGGYKTAASRSVAQSGSAPRSGRGGRRFKSCHSDHTSHGPFRTHGLRFIPETWVTLLSCPVVGDGCEAARSLQRY